MFEPIVKLARLFPAFAHVAALAIMALGAAPLRAAGPVEGLAPSNNPRQFSWDTAERRLMNEGRFDEATARAAKARSYNLGTATASDRNLNFESSARDKSMLGPSLGLLARKRGGIGITVEADAEWSPRIANWRGSGARLLGIDRERLNNAQSGLVTVLDRHLVRSRLTLSRHRIQVELTTGF
jgi:hypothetical protein